MTRVLYEMSYMPKRQKGVYGQVDLRSQRSGGGKRGDLRMGSY